RKNCWNTKPIRPARSADSSRSDSAETSCPSIRTVPALGRSSVPSRFSTVDLPEPDGPTIATRSPYRMDRQTPRGARRPAGPHPPPVPDGKTAPGARLHPGIPPPHLVQLGHARPVGRHDGG